MKRVRYKQSEIRALAIIAAAGRLGLSFLPGAMHGVRHTTIKALLTSGLALESAYDSTNPYHVTLTDAGHDRLLRALLEIREARTQRKAAAPFNPDAEDIRQCLEAADLPRDRVARLTPKLIDAFRIGMK